MYRNEVVEEKIVQLQKAVQEQFGEEVLGSVVLFLVQGKDDRGHCMVMEQGPDDLFISGENRLKLIHALSSWGLEWCILAEDGEDETV